MFDFPSFSVWSLWILFVLMFLFAWMVMAIADKVRGVRIENREDHRNAGAGLVGMLPFFALIVLLVFTPIVPGPLFWVGCALNLVAMVLYLLSIAAFVKARRGVTTVGIYRLSRNPMYIALFVILVAFAFMASSAAPVMGVLTIMVMLWQIAAIHWMVLGEERFLEGKYGETYVAYKRSVPRYLLF
jgi:protein-S-isoprenylcysteine O-methyltransferase Ste14